MVNVGKYTVSPMDASWVLICPDAKELDDCPYLVCLHSPLPSDANMEQHFYTLHSQAVMKKTLEQLSEHVWFIDSWHTMYFDLRILRIYMYMHCIYV